MSRPSFADLQMRLHPAESRIKKLAATTPRPTSFFSTCSGGQMASRLIDRPLMERRSALERFGDIPLARTRRFFDPVTLPRVPCRTAVRWLEASPVGRARTAWIAKRLDDRYRARVNARRSRSSGCEPQIASSAAFGTGATAALSDPCFSAYMTTGETGPCGLYFIGCT